MGEDKINTKDIVLEQVTVEQFNAMERFWKKGRIKKKISVYSAISNPITDTDYENLFHRFLESDNAYRISVNDKGKWKKAFFDSATPSKIKDLAEIAANDTKKYNFLELAFGEPNSYKKAVVGFIELNGSIIGYEMAVPEETLGMFTMVGNLPSRGQRAGYKWNNGLWVPENCGNLRVPITRRASPVERMRSSC